ncbi:hypothetical protein K13PH07C1L_LOCUS39 [Klebsiella phage vB_Kpn_K13PH07C1L]|uniref:Uncharacterized protein n=1 Tax=Klebsiella phage vB_Kpn_K13PH07C1L TaxID=3071649 RepID=A0AAV1MGB3_9CAUD|nr:hypothetical protein K13PH07C1L_LOCUS39 [Klebsiella phage vB_Kpn_K13PH07C1L]CAK6604761.1 hypothetical protein K13PH07C1S_LOCUS38 [Klebsiella phage vB_Kpn_K13PH07C1S]
MYEVHPTGITARNIGGHPQFYIKLLGCLVIDVNCMAPGEVIILHIERK